MAKVTDYIKKSFDILSARSSDDTAEAGVYANTRSENGHFSSNSTQSGVSTYAAYEAETIGEMPGSVLPRELKANIDPDIGSD